MSLFISDERVRSVQLWSPATDKKCRAGLRVGKQTNSRCSLCPSLRKLLDIRLLYFNGSCSYSFTATLGDAVAAVLDIYTVYCTIYFLHVPEPGEQCVIVLDYCMKL